MKKPTTKAKPTAKDNELKQIAELASRYAVADPGKDARDDLFRRMAKLA